MLKQHSHYVYYSENRIMARKGDLAPVVARVCETPQEAHDAVQEIVNPGKLRHDDPSFEGQGFHHPLFQLAISGNCADFVEQAYVNAAKAGG